MRYEDISGYFTNILHLITITNVISRVVVSILIDDIAIYFWTVESFIKTSILVFLSITSYLVCYMIKQNANADCILRAVHDSKILI